MRRSQSIFTLAMGAVFLGAGAVAAQSPSAGAPAGGTGYAELDAAMGPDQPFAGQTITIQTQWIEGEGANFDASLQPFEDATGITVNQEGIFGQHGTLLRARLEGGIPLDLAMLAQPAVLRSYGEAGLLTPINDILDIDKLTAEHAATVPLYTSGDNVWGIPYKVDIKSTVWYPIKAFEAAGYAVPTTWDELLALSQKIVDDGNGSPWCIGMEAGADTGWQATDWVEDIVLRTAGIDAYNKWITHELPFNSPEIKAAFDEAGKIFFGEGYVLGGTTGIVSTPQTEPMDPMFPPDGNWDGFTPGCWMQKQATWYGPDFFPDQRTTKEPSQYVLGEDIGLFYFPAVNGDAPLLGAGDALLVPKPPDGSEVRDSVKALAQYLSTPQGVEAWVKAGSALSANTTTPADWYQGYKSEVSAEIVANATSFGFDASDLMPPVVGNGTFWSESIKWIECNGADTEATLQAIDDSWPAS
jgi:alpha-glucoside transport system substrate-binding protein